jgi:hypothetical protein
MGCNGYIFSIPLLLELIATRGWVSHTWNFAKEVGIEIRDDIKDFVSPRLNDKLLIPMFGSMGFRGQEILYLNQCRLFLKVLWLSELTTADGIFLERQSLLPPFSISCHRRYIFPTQGYPSREAWATWQRALRKLCQNDQSFRLKERLGRWIDRDSIRWWYDQRTQRLYDSAVTPIKKFQLTRRTSTRSSTSLFSEMGSVHNLPPQAQPATVQLNHCTRLTGLGSLADSLKTIHIDCPDWIINNIQLLPDAMYQFKQNQHSLIAVSDGSFKNGHGTAAWILYFSDSCSCVGRVVVLGGAQDQSAYRSELTGLYATAISVRLLERRFGIIGSVTVGCDGLSALHQVSKSADFIDPSVS